MVNNWLGVMFQGKNNAAHKVKTTQVLSQQKLMLLQLENKKCITINVDPIKEVIKSQPLQQLRYHHPFIIGLASINNQSIPIIDISLAIGEKPLGNRENAHIVLTEYQNAKQGFIVAKVDRILDKKLEEIHSLPAKFNHEVHLFCKAMTMIHGQWIEIIDVAHILNDIYESPIDNQGNNIAPLTKTY